MRKSLLAVVAAFALAILACAPDTVGPNRDAETVPSGPGLTTQAAEQEVRDLLETLMAFILPNDQSIVGKFNRLMQVKGDPDLIGTALDDLISKLEGEVQKYTQPPRNGSLTDCVDGTQTPGCETVAEMRDRVIALIYELVGLDGDANICKINASDPNFTLCETPDDEDGNGQPDGFVFFPPGIADKLTFVSIKNVPKGLFSGLDESPVVLQIQVAPVTTFTDELPTVVTCFATIFSPKAAERALLGQRHVDENGEDSYFKLLPPANLNADLQAKAEEYCGTEIGGDGPSLSRFGLTGSSTLGRLVHRAIGFFMPEPAHASRAAFFLGFAGASGSPEEFSRFAAVDPGISFGGASGSPEEFTPRADFRLFSSAATADLVGTAGTSAEAATASLPTVTLVTPGAGTPVANVKVTFTLQDPDPENYSPASEAALCNDQTEVDVTTGSDGIAELPCIEFGEQAGYRNLKATFDPSGVDPLACMINEAGLCDDTVERNFLVRTDPGPAAAISTFMPSATPSASATYDYGAGQEDVAVADPPQVRVTDAYGNTVGAGIGITWSPETASNGAVLVPGAGTTTSEGGLAQATSWTLGPGFNSVIASISALGDDSPVATFRATVPTGQTVFECALGGNKTDLGRITFPRPGSNTIRTITLYLSVTGQASAQASYPATISVKKGTTQIGYGAGNVILPGNNGIATPVTFELTDPALGSETSGSGNLWIDLEVTTPSQRKIQVWHVNNPRNNDPCFNSLVYAPGSTTSFKRGLSMKLTN